MAPRGAQFWGAGGAVTLGLDLSEINRTVKSLGATEKQVKFAISRALRRTATTLRARVNRAAVSELQLRRARDFRKRMRDLKLRASKGGDMIGIWVGLNDLAVSQFKGTPTEYAAGAKFRQIEYPGAFVAKVGRKRRSIYKRSGRGRFPIREQTIPIKDDLDVVLEDDVFPDIVDVFIRNFMSDLRARTQFGVGQK